MTDDCSQRTTYTLGILPVPGVLPNFVLPVVPPFCFRCGEQRGGHLLRRWMQNIHVIVRCSV